jgi:hypothetical protein
MSRSLPHSNPLLVGHAIWSVATAEDLEACKAESISINYQEHLQPAVFYQMPHLKKRKQNKIKDMKETTHGTHFE